MYVFFVSVVMGGVDAWRKGHILPVLHIDSFFEDLLLFLNSFKVFLLAIEELLDVSCAFATATVD